MESVAQMRGHKTPISTAGLVYANYGEPALTKRVVETFGRKELKKRAGALMRRRFYSYFIAVVDNLYHNQQPIYRTPFM